MMILARRYQLSTRRLSVRWERHTRSEDLDPRNDSRIRLSNLLQTGKGMIKRKIQRGGKALVWNVLAAGSLRFCEPSKGSVSQLDRGTQLPLLPLRALSGIGVRCARRPAGPQSRAGNKSVFPPDLGTNPFSQSQNSGGRR